MSIDSNGSVHAKKDDGRAIHAERERRKIPLRRNREAAFLFFLQFHAIPLGVALALTILNIKGRYLGTDIQWINLLQFIAKLHEVLMQLSIATVMVAYLQGLLTSSSAVPFGAIFSAASFTQVGYLLSREFRAAVTTRGFPTWLKVGFALFVPSSILLAAGVGPASAIAMLPRQVNYTLPDWPLALNLSYMDLYPASVTQPGPPLDGQFYSGEISLTMRSVMSLIVRTL
jgi:hypothetical protein